MDVVEISPALDHADLTCHLGAHLLFEGLSPPGDRPMIRRLCGIRLDAMRACATRDVTRKALASQWIAANVCAISGIRSRPRDIVPTGARLVHVEIRSLTALLGLLAALPGLVNPAGLPLRWRLAVRALGIPTLDRAAANVVVAGGASVILPSYRARAA